MQLGKSLEARIREKAAELGFAACGIARADAAPLAGRRLREWLAEGRHGDMIWMAERAHHRESPAGLWPEVRSVCRDGERIEIVTDAAEIVVRQLLFEDSAVSELEVQRAGLAEAFVEITREAA